MDNITVKEALKKLGTHYSPAFEFYIKKLNRRNKLPRGKYFKKRTAGNKTYFRDEYWMMGFNTEHTDEIIPVHYNERSKSA